jgi:ABC-type transporter Mla maintaining outer membrane lipid asymmetry ATPase subunit MlaF
MSIHTPDDVVGVADSMAFVAEGRIRAAGPPAGILASDDPAVVRFLGRRLPAAPRASAP